MRALLLEYGQSSTIAGLQYAFKPKQSFFGRFFWIFTVCILTLLGAWLSVENYLQWKDNPVLTTISTTGLPISEVQFPSVIICSQGFDIYAITTAIYNSILLFMGTDSVREFQLTPIQTAKLLHRFWDGTVTKEEHIKASEISQFLLSNQTTKVVSELYGKNIDISELSYFILISLFKTPNNYLKVAHKSLEMVITEQLTSSKNITDWSALQLKIESFFNDLNSEDSYYSLLDILWFSSLPCFDVQTLTAENDGETGILKQCYWKSMPIACAAIFRKVPTDDGMCCAFNKDEADKIFVESNYTGTLKEFNEFDSAMAFEPPDNSSVWYKEKKEPISQVGTKMGLTVMLDAHTDILTELSVTDDFEGFTAIVTPPNDFPLMFQQGFGIKTGQKNDVALSAIQLTADDGLRSIQPDKRNCFFPNEAQYMKLHLKYSQSNCLLECSLKFAQEAQYNKTGQEMCTPWYFPIIGKKHKICDPWETQQLSHIMANQVPQKTCDYCLPDCNRIIYQHSISLKAFRKCNEKNFGMSPLCTIDLNGNVPKPHIWGKLALDRMQNSSKDYEKIQGKIVSSKRFLKPRWFRNNFVTNSVIEYDAYENDIAILNVYFETPTVLVFTTQHSKTWLDFISAVGGNGGLFIGFSIVTILEIIWLFSQAFLLHLKH